MSRTSQFSGEYVMDLQVNMITQSQRSRKSCQHLRCIEKEDVHTIKYRDISPTETRLERSDLPIPLLRLYRALNGRRCMEARSFKEIDHSSNLVLVLWALQIQFEDEQGTDRVRDHRPGTPDRSKR